MASGGEDDRAFVWDRTKSTGDDEDGGQVILKCDGFKDSVVNVAFSHDGTYFAAADMAGNVKVWKLSNGNLIFEFETSDISVG